MPVTLPFAATSGSRLLDRIQEDIAKANDQRVSTELVMRYTCSPEEFHDIEDFLEESVCKRVFFDAAEHCLRFILMPTVVHGVCGAWLSGWASQFPAKVKEHLRVQSETDVNELGIDGRSKKIPDTTVYVERRVMPTIALEVGYSESYDDLINDATLLLEGSRGRVGIVILIKLAPLTALQQSVQSGFVEMHTYDKDTRKRVKFGSRMRLFPPTVKHNRQNITLQWKAVLREQRSKIDPPTESPPPLKLDELRRLIDQAAMQAYLGRTGETAQAEENADIF
ncbi:uncharacterized protein TRUGW13939_07676 [Talaromyces rugulosus]|uniref:Uncharacterized protein n=1 Tax=Talaromyces rugulosus TaxID=121627 RepID=A0A7H8R4C4_TALRU|nr:uncharacterized protein TRUGW13939_07676 [Talaromyces rugulosus]QKX60531.1 hypothetical protein TRUGW13939_07676 [Talaromyces rugulosus]